MLIVNIVCKRVDLMRLLLVQGPTQDDVIAILRAAFTKIVEEYKVYTEEEKKKVTHSIRSSF
jgi:hypothetical protein